MSEPADATDDAHGAAGRGPWRPSGPDRRLRHVGWLVFALLGAVLTASSVAAQDPAWEEDAVREAREIICKANYQRDLPGFRNDAPGSDARSGDGKEVLPRGPVCPSDNRPQWRISLPAEVGAILRLLLWMAIFVSAALLLYLAAGEFSSARWGANRLREGGVGENGTDAAGWTAGTVDFVSESERLAAAGEYAEAVHLLLLGALERLREALDVELGASLTSRELVERLGLAGERRSAFGVLVSTVELSRFGGRRLDARVYAKCQQCYATLADGPGGGAR